MDEPRVLVSKLKGYPLSITDIKFRDCSLSAKAHRPLVGGGGYMIPIHHLTKILTVQSPLYRLCSLQETNDEDQ